MGDRANFGFRIGRPDYRHTLYLYGHWAGENMLDRLANALKEAGPRWNDEAYATRIVTSQLVGDRWPYTTGWGLTLDYLCDSEHDVPVVDFEAGTVTIHAYDGHPAWAPTDANRVESFTLDGFIQAYGPITV